jgi:hypothetical protein
MKAARRWSGKYEKETKKMRDLDKYSPGWRDTKHGNGQPKFAKDGMMLDEKGNRSIFDDVDE